MNNPNHLSLYQIAESQAGYFTAQQAQKAGFSWERISDNTRTGKFQRFQAGVYRLVQFPASPYEDLFVAWLSIGSTAVISHESALGLYELSDLLAAEIHLTVSRTTSRRRKGLRLHTNQIEKDEITRRHGLPVTTVERTIVDLLSSHQPMEIIEQAVQQALQNGYISEKSLVSQSLRRSKKLTETIKNILKQGGDEIRE